LESEFPTLIKLDGSVVVSADKDWLRAIADVLGVVIIQFTANGSFGSGFVRIPDPCEERDAVEKEEFITDGHSDSCLSSNKNLKIKFWGDLTPWPKAKECLPLDPLSYQVLF
jgi:hypothetical protein